MGTSYNSSIVTDGLVLCLDAANPRSYPLSGNTWLDLSGQGNNGTLTNGPTFSSANGGGIVFDGTNDYINCGSFANNFISNPGLNNGIISFSVWCYVTKPGSYYILSSGGQTGSTGIAFSYQGGSPFSAIQNGTKSGAVYISSSDFPLNTWLNWTTTCDADYIHVYRNGILKGSETLVAQSRTDTQTLLTMGVPNNNLSLYALGGKVSYVTFYNKTLSADEVRRNYNATRGRYGN